MIFDKVFERFCRLADLSRDEAAKWTYLVHDCIFEISENVLIPDFEDERICHRLTAVTAALAFYKYTRINSARGDISGFKAGDLTVNIDGSAVCGAFDLYCEELAKISDIIKNKDFIFGRTDSFCTEI